ncbi:hypothetical protein JCM31598_36630 [Desulfonatronum parangueonense]
MFSFWKKKPDPLELIRDECRQGTEALATSLEAALSGMEETLRKTATQVRRQGVALEMLREAQEQKLGAVHALLAERHGQDRRELLTFAEAFVLYIASRTEEDESLRQAAHKFFVFLKSQGIEAIWDLHGPFDDSRHQVCDARNDPSLPDAVVLEVVRPGFVIHGQVNPPALVVVNKRSSNLTLIQGE